MRRLHSKRVACGLLGLLWLGVGSARAQEPTGRTPERSTVYPLPSAEGQDQAGAAAAARSESPEEVLHDALRLVRSGGAEGHDLARQKLRRLGSSLVPMLLDTLLQPGQLADDKGPLLDAQGRALLVDLLSEHDPSEVVHLIAGRLDVFSTLSTRLRSIELVGTFGGAGSFEVLLQLIGEIDPVDRQHRACTEVIETSVAEILMRDDRGWYALRSHTEGMDRPLLKVMARAVGRTQSGDGLIVLERLLGRDPQLDVAAIQAIGRLHPWDKPCRQGAAAELLSPLLGSREPEVRRAAALAIGPHAGAEHAGDLIQLLGDLEPRVSEAALASLRTLSGSNWGPQTERWTSWYEREFAWYEERSEELCHLAQGHDAGPAFRALRELSSHCLFRSELSVELEGLPARANEDLALAACAALGRLGGPEAVQALSSALRDGRPEVKSAAAEALQSITRGHPLPF